VPVRLIPDDLGEHPFSLPSPEDLDHLSQRFFETESRQEIAGDMESVEAELLLEMREMSARLS
jgi:hypothetical protein